MQLQIGIELIELTLVKARIVRHVENMFVSGVVSEPVLKSWFSETGHFFT